MSDKGSINNITLPVSKRLTKDTQIAIKNAIEADKDIISKIQITYDEEGLFTSIVFPKGIIPLTIRGTISGVDVQMYFKFDDDEIVDENETKLYDTEYHTVYQDKFDMTIENVNLTETLVIKSLTYVRFDNDNGSVNPINDTYHLYFPQDVRDAPNGSINYYLGLASNGKVVKGNTSGSGLYLHTLQTNRMWLTIRMINNSPEQITGNINADKAQQILNNVHSFSRCQTSTSTTRYWPIMLYYYSGDLSTVLHVYYVNTDNNQFAFDTVNSITSDTVTAL